MNKPELHPCPPRARSRRQRRFGQTGASLIELMVGITIGLLVTLAAIGTLAYNRVSATLVSDSVRMQQDASIAMRMIGRQVKQAAAVPALEHQPGGAITNRFTYRQDYGGFDGSNVLVPVSVNGTNAPDTLTISFANDASIPGLVTNCLGNANVNVNITSTFDVTNTSVFRCNGNGNTQPVINNVEDFQVWYAVRNPATNGVRYFNATQVGAAGIWGNVEAILVCLRMSSPSTGNPTSGLATPGCLAGQNIADDGRLRRVFRQVFTLRNVADLG